MTRYIQLTQGYQAIVDDEDHEELSKFKWHYHLGYAIRTVYTGGKYIKIRMHRVVMNCPADKEIDHVDGNKLDNRRCNLRICTRADNVRNIQVNTLGKSSKYKGVTWKKQSKKWCAQISLRKKKIYLGLFTDEKSAAIAYNQAAQKYFGEFARLNEVQL